MIKSTFSNSDKVLVEAFRRYGDVIIRRLTVQLEKSMIKLQSHIVQDKMQGQVLQHKSGTAAASVRVEGVTAEGGVLTGSVVGGGGPAFHLNIQEKGGTRWYDIYPKNKEALAFFPGGSLGGGAGVVQVARGTLQGLYRRSGTGGKELKPGKVGQFGQLGGVVVKHVHHPPLPARPVMSTGLEEMRAVIVDDLRKAVMGGVGAV